MSSPIDDELARLHETLGWSTSPFWKLWAKFEIVFGLAAVGASVLLAQLVVQTGRYDRDLTAVVIPFALAGHLALAGHRSHLYQSNNRLAAYVATLIRDPRNPHEHSG